MARSQAEGKHVGQGVKAGEPRSPERDSTDQSLNHERSKTDDELALARRAEAAGRVVTNDARALTDEQVRLNRAAADVARKNRSADPPAEVRAERQRADAALGEERVLADEALANERAGADRHGLAEGKARRDRLRLFLETERTETDSDLAHERRESDNALLVERGALATAVEGSSARDDFLGVVAHDIRSPLNTILLSMVSLSRSAPPEGDGGKIRRTAGVVNRAVARISVLLDDLLDVASLEAGRLSIERRPYSASSLVTEVVEMLTPLARERDIELTTELEPTDAAVSCDAGRIGQVFTNLIGNALKYMTGPGRIVITSTIRPHHVELAVEDTGPGIASEQLVSIFERFSRGDTHGQHGTGLGLYISRGIVEAHGGALTVTSEPGQGARFAFTLPRAATR